MLFNEGPQLTRRIDGSYVPYTPESNSITSCGVPQDYDASKEFADKKVVLFAVPGTLSLVLPSVASNGGSSEDKRQH